MSNRVNVMDLKWAKHIVMAPAYIALDVVSFGRNLPICGLCSWNRERKA